MSSTGEDLSSIIKPEYLSNFDKDIKALPTEVKSKLIAHTQACSALAFNPMGDTIATSGEDKVVKLWSLKRNALNETHTIKSKTNAVCALNFSLDNDYLVSCTTDHRINLYSLRGQFRARHSFQGHSDLISAARFVFSQKQLVTAG